MSGSRTGHEENAMNDKRRWGVWLLALCLLPLAWPFVEFIVWSAAK